MVQYGFVTMNLPGILALVVAPSFRLEPGDYRYFPVPVRHTPAEIDCHFHVEPGGGAVHLELLDRHDLRLFFRGREHQTLASTASGTDAAFRRIVDEPGDYDVVVVNDKKNAPATVLLQVNIDTTPEASVAARELTPARRLTVILISFALFFAIVIWSGRRLFALIR